MIASTRGGLMNLPGAQAAHKWTLGCSARPQACCLGGLQRHMTPLAAARWAPAPPAAPRPALMTGWPAPRCRVALCYRDGADGTAARQQGGTPLAAGQEPSGAYPR
jgi:hypothetical protein